MTWRAGFGTADITAFDPAMCLFGWAVDGNKPCGVAMPLLARALVLEDPASRRRVAYVVCDLGMISESVRRAVAKIVCTSERGLEEHDLVVTATHTHSGPNGFSTYMLYAITAPGVSREVHDAIVAGVVAAIDRAVAALRPARLWTTSGWIPASEPIAFNRSIRAYNRNHDVSPVGLERTDDAVDRTMTVLRVDAIEGPPLGVVAWFAVHGTSLHSDNRWVHGDNKGYASIDFEDRERGAGNAEFVAMFPQEAAGDVSPNYRLSTKRGFLIGRYDDDDESARFNGDTQARHARMLWAAAPSEGEELACSLDSALRHRDFFTLEGTSAPRVGLAFSVGTREGRGPFHAIRRAMPLLVRLQQLSLRWEEPGSWRAAHGAKFPLWDLGFGERNKVLGVLSLVNPILRFFSDERVDYYQRALGVPAARDVSWVPRHLPFQILRLGSLSIATLPHEATTVAGRRIREALGRVLGGRIVVSPYSNAYCGYLTTPEEYDAQCYEGAATLYGRESLAAVIGALVEIASAMKLGGARATLGRIPRTIPLEWCLSA